MMDMSNKMFLVDDVSLHDLEKHLNDLAADDRWVLHSIDYVGRDGDELPSFTVIAHRAYDWETHFEQKRKFWEEKKKAEEKLHADKRAVDKAVEKWALTMGTTGGHANE